METTTAAANAITNNTTIEMLQSNITDNHTKGLASEKSANSSLSVALIYYRDCGKDIISLKAECKTQGISYLPELEKTGVKERTGQRYKQLAEHDRTKDVEADFFKDMLSPTLTTVLQALSFKDEDWKKVISGDNSPFDKKEKKDKKTQQELDDEKKNKIKTAFDKYKYQNINFEQFQTYYEISRDKLIEILDETISQNNHPGLYQMDTDDVKEQEQLDVNGVEA